MNTFRATLASLACLGAVQFYAAPAVAADYFVQPVTPGTVTAPSLASYSLPAAPASTQAKLAPIGSVVVPPAASQWKSLGALLQSGQVKGGDRIFLLGGYHYPISLRTQRFTSTVTISALPGAVAQVPMILVNDSANITFRNISVWTPPGSNRTTNLIRTYANSPNINFDGMDVRGAPDAPSYLNWALSDWQTYQTSAFFVEGPNSAVTNSRVTGIYNGIIMAGDNALLEGNIVDGFAGDGTRALGDDSIVRRNRIQNCFVINAAHRDGFQSYSRGPGGIGTGTVYRIVIEENYIYEWTWSQPNALRCSLQGISMFDGMYDGFRIENNVLVTSAYHGITIAGAINTSIRQNTLSSATGQTSKFPWIRIASHKNGTPPQNDVVANNFAPSIRLPSNTALNVVGIKNIAVGNPTNDFVSFSTFDLRPKSSSKAVDAGDVKSTSTDDINGAKRWKGKGPDAGAYEAY